SLRRRGLDGLCPSPDPPPLLRPSSGVVRGGRGGPGGSGAPRTGGAGSVTTELVACGRSSVGSLTTRKRRSYASGTPCTGISTSSLMRSETAPAAGHLSRKGRYQD